MYIFVVLPFMVILPLASIAVEASVHPSAGLITILGKWFVFWALGMRLFTAGLRQMIQPEFTARSIFDIKDPSAFTVVSELGVSNLAIGVIALSSLALSTWTAPAAVYGLIFYGVAAARHLRNAHRNRNEVIATWSDLWAAVVLAGFLAATLMAYR